MSSSPTQDSQRSSPLRARWQARPLTSMSQLAVLPDEMKSKLLRPTQPCWARRDSSTGTHGMPSVLMYRRKANS